mmetsp:Transcript_18494/g.46852  ORF Transcript_18494/g.46852 Transcript_18494/m.46852 type:complete len:214 (-) Transcript_18494:238-879(-)
MKCQCQNKVTRRALLHSCTAPQPHSATTRQRVCVRAARSQLSAQSSECRNSRHSSTSSAFSVSPTFISSMHTDEYVSSSTTSPCLLVTSTSSASYAATAWPARASVLMVALCARLRRRGDAPPFSSSCSSARARSACLPAANAANSALTVASEGVCPCILDSRSIARAACPPLAMVLIAPSTAGDGRAILSAFASVMISNARSQSPDSSALCS